MRILLSSVLVAFVLHLQADLAGAQVKKPDPPKTDPVKKGPVEEKKATEVGGKTIDQWILELHSKDRAKGEIAVVAIMNFRFDQAYKALPHLLKLLEDSSYQNPLDASLRLEITKAVGMLGEGAVQDKKTDRTADIERSIKVLTTKMLVLEQQWNVRIQALESLARFGPAAHSATTEILLNLSNKEERTWTLRSAAAKALAPIAYDAKAGPDQKVIDGLVRALDDSCSQVRASASQTIMILGSTAAGKTKLDLDLFKAASRETEIPVQIGMYTALVSIDGSSAQVGRNHLMELIKHKDASTRAQAMQSITLLGAFFGPPRNNSAAREKLDVAVLAAAAKETDPKIQIPILTFVGLTFVVDSKPAKDAVKQLTLHLIDKDADTRMQAIRGLAATGERAKDAVPKLLALVQTESDAKVKITILTAVVTVEAPAGTAGVKLLIPYVDEKEKDLNIRVLAIRALGVAGERAKEAVPKLSANLVGEHPELFMPSIHTLGAIGKGAHAAVSDLKRFADDKTLGERLKKSLKPAEKKGITDDQVKATVERLQNAAHNAIDAIESRVELTPTLTKDPKKK